MSRADRRWPAAAALLLVGFLAGGGRATLYDGVGFPDDPYRYVGGVPAPRAVQRTVALPTGRSTAFELRSAEQGPQVQVDADAAALQGGGDAATVRADPVAPVDGPREGALDSNVYRLSASGRAQPGPARSCCSCARPS